jgi:hypothetical protein
LRQVVVALALALVVAWLPQTATAASYAVTVSMADWDIYWDSVNSIAVLTQSCNYITYYDSATLVYEVGATNNKLIFSSGPVCTVEAVHEPNARLERVGDNLYRDVGTQRIVRTQSCVRLALSEVSLILRDRVIFLEAGQACSRTP